VAIGLCRRTWSQRGLCQEDGGSVIRWYNVRIGGGWSCSRLGRFGIGVVNVIFLLVIFGVTGLVSGGRFALGWHSCW